MYIDALETNGEFHSGRGGDKGSKRGGGGFAEELFSTRALPAAVQEEGFSTCQSFTSVPPSSASTLSFSLIRQFFLPDSSPSRSFPPGEIGRGPARVTLSNAVSSKETRSFFLFAPRNVRHSWCRRVKRNTTSRSGERMMFVR